MNTFESLAKQATESPELWAAILSMAYTASRHENVLRHPATKVDEWMQAANDEGSFILQKDMCDNYQGDAADWRHLAERISQSPLAIMIRVVAKILTTIEMEEKREKGGVFVDVTVSPDIYQMILTSPITTITGDSVTFLGKSIVQGNSQHGHMMFHIHYPEKDK